MPHIDIMSVVGSAVPEALRAQGHLACWFVMIDGQCKSGPYTTLDMACASKAIWELEWPRWPSDTRVSWPWPPEFSSACSGAFWQRGAARLFLVPIPHPLWPATWRALFFPPGPAAGKLSAFIAEAPRELGHFL